MNTEEAQREFILGQIRAGLASALEEKNKYDSLNFNKVLSHFDKDKFHEERISDWVENKKGYISKKKKFREDSRKTIVAELERTKELIVKNQFDLSTAEHIIQIKAKYLQQFENEMLELLYPLAIDTKTTKIKIR